jgi:hypothetical protein
MQEGNSAWRAHKEYGDDWAFPVTVWICTFHEESFTIEID